LKTVNEKEARKSILEESEKMNNSAFEDAWNDKKKSIRKSSQVSFVKRFLIDIKDLFLLVKDFMTGKYKDIPFWTIIAILGALIYVVNPLDLAPDVIPILGLIDDILVLFLCTLMVRKDLSKYRSWKNRQ
jgi:uncharacterized membrane protein YkvA (DUF1232 family)